MSTVQTTPLLRSGMHLSSEEFLRRWYAMPDVKFAELINGVVQMPSPLSFDHGDHDNLLAGWIAMYALCTPGLRGSNNVTCVFDKNNVPQPDLSLRILPAYGGQTGVDGRLLTGAPELAIEVAVTSLAADMGVKLKLYQTAGVQEYIVAEVESQELHWHRLHKKKYQPIKPEADGILRSKVFPGLWLDAVAFYQYDQARFQEVLQAGLQSPEHAAFVEKLRQQHTPA